MIDCVNYLQVTGVPRKKSRNPASRRAELKRLMDERNAAAAAASSSPGEEEWNTYGLTDEEFGNI